MMMTRARVKAEAEAHQERAVDEVLDVYRVRPTARDVARSRPTLVSGT